MGYMHYGKVVVVDSTSNGSDVEVYVDRLALVLDLIGDGSIGRGGGVAMFGSDEHVAALAAIDARVAEVRAKIAREAADEIDEDADA